MGENLQNHVLCIFISEKHMFGMNMAKIRISGLEG